MKPDPHRPSGFLAEEERGPDGRLVRGAVVFLASRHCPWRCVYCDLGRGTTPQPVPAGAIPAQLDFALNSMGTGHAALPEQIKLYNHGSFFDRAAVPPGDLPAIAARLQSFRRVIVESHPALVGDRVLGFRDLLPGRLEVAMGLETAHPEVLARLNKRMTLDQFARAARFLTDHGIDVRAFILVQPPFLAPSEAVEWAVRSVRFAAACAVSVAVLIPTRGGTAALDALAARGEFAPPRLAVLEAAQEQGIATGQGRVFADTWDLGRFAECDRCRSARVRRIDEMNRTQECRPRVACACAPG